MVIGRRSDVPIRNRTIYILEDVKKVAKADGKLHSSYGIDYFAIASNNYPWHKVPDLVIGRPAYDNFLVATATRYNVSVVDATDTVIALHQTDADGLNSGHRRSDSDYNRRIIRRYTAGLQGCTRTNCAKYKTRRLTKGSIEVVTRFPRRS